MLALAVLSFAFAHLSRPLHVAGREVIDDGGHVVRFHGVNIPSLEWTAAGDHVMDSVRVALDDWHANFIRLPMSEDRWFGKAPDSKDDGTSYRKIVDDVVAAVNERGAHVMLDLHWSNAGVWGQNIGQHDLPDSGSLDFWKSCSQRFANNPAVLFDLYNEPISGPWDAWQRGGPVSEEFNGQHLSYQAVGMQTLIDAIRTSGAKNIIVSGGLGYASRFDGLPTHPLVEHGGNGIVYSNHFYPGWESVDSWEPRIVDAAKRWPILVGEFGSDPLSIPLGDPPHQVALVLDALRRNDLNWCAWCMHPAATPCLIKDWTYQPTPYFGAFVKMALAGQAVRIPARRSTTDDHVVYDGKFQNGFQYWGSAKVDFAAKPAVKGTASMRVEAESGKQVQLGTVPFDGLPYRSISLWLNGGPQGGQALTLAANVMDKEAGKFVLPTLKPGEWTHLEVPFDALGIAGQENVKSFALRATDGQGLAPYMIADVVVEGKR